MKKYQMIALCRHILERHGAKTRLTGLAALNKEDAADLYETLTTMEGKINEREG